MQALALLNVQNLSARRAERVLYENLSFELYPGEILQIIAGNGVGKSTLLQQLLGFPLESGSVTWQPTQAFYYLGHQLGLKPALSVAEHLQLSLLYPKPSDASLKKALTYFNLTALKNRLCSQLSQGQKQKVALTQCLLSLKPVWLLDEPFTALDAKSIVYFEEEMAQHLKQQGSIILISHRSLSSHFPVRSIFLEEYVSLQDD